jgi:hypothetical protein
MLDVTACIQMRLVANDPVAIDVKRVAGLNLIYLSGTSLAQAPQSAFTKFVSSPVGACWIGQQYIFSKRIHLEHTF